MSTPLGNEIDRLQKENKELKRERDEWRESSCVATTRRIAAEKEREHVAWCRYVRAPDQPPRIVLCDSNDEGAFKVYR